MSGDGKHYCDDEVDEAIRTVERAKHSGEVPVVAAVPIDDVHPWWTTLRLPLTIIAVSLLLFSISLTSLAVLALSDARETTEQRDLRTCRDRYTAEITEAAAETRLTTAELTNMFNRGLIDLIETGTVESIDAQELAVAIAANEQSMIEDAEAIAARERWMAEGSPLPCPLDAPEPPDE